MKSKRKTKYFKEFSNKEEWKKQVINMIINPCVVNVTPSLQYRLKSVKIIENF